MENKMGETIIREMQSKDVPEVLKIESELLGKTSASTIESTLSSDALTYYVLEVAGEICGFYEVSIIAPEAELFDVAVKTNFQGKGLGKELISHLLKTCEQHSVSTIFLEVNSINRKAINLYNSFGFVPYATRKNYYGENDAILMKKQM